MRKQGEAVADVKVPSVAWRAFVAVALLVGFYVTIATVAMVLFVAPVALIIMGWDSDRSPNLFQMLLWTALAWTPGALLTRGLFLLRAPRFEPPGPVLRRADAPGLYDMLDELARKAGTDPPVMIYASPLPTLGVTQEGGLFSKARRILIVGLPLLDWFTVQETRAVLAHELGHYIGGDTRLHGILNFTRALFRSVIESAHRPGQQSNAYAQGIFDFARLVSVKIVGAYAWIYLRLTRPSGRLQESAADVLSARLAGAEAAQSALRKTDAIKPIFETYIQAHVARALAAGAMPSDLLPGFARMRDRLAESDVEAKIAKASLERSTDAFDTHPSTAERLELLAAQPKVEMVSDDREARILLAIDLEDALRDALHSIIDVPPTDLVSWTDMPAKVFAPAMKKDADRIAALMAPAFPEAKTFAVLLGELVRTFQAQRTEELALIVEPSLLMVHRNMRGRPVHEVATSLLQVVLHGALIEAGAEPRYAFDDVFLSYGWQGEDVRPTVLAIEAMTSGHAANRVLALAESFRVARTSGTTDARIAS